MKYMGGKTALLGGRLGEILLSEADSASRFVDLFGGSGAVAHFAAQHLKLPILSVDLQEYARVFASAVIERTCSLVGDPALTGWLATPVATLAGHEPIPVTADLVHAARVAAAAEPEGFITRHYGGHYFSLSQAQTLDSLYAALPASGALRTVALAALLQAASACAAAPGHTAQPFQPTATLLPYIRQAWTRDVSESARIAVEQIAPAFAAVRGEARVGDAQSVVETLQEGDLVFCDPPYSAVQYSRFYHVLEGIARGGWDEVGGKGRAPARTRRETSEFSMKSKAPAAMKKLVAGLRQCGCRAIITFPNADASNGLSANDIIAMTEDDWIVRAHYLDSVHSTLGGRSGSGPRGGRKKLKEAVLVLSPRSSVVSMPVKFPPGSIEADGDRVAAGVL